MIKKIITLLLCTIMVLGVSINVSADTIGILAENYTLPADYYYIRPNGDKILCGWMPYNTTDPQGRVDRMNNNAVTTWGDKGGIYEHFIVNLKGAWYANEPVTAKFYIEKPGTYYIWSLVWNETGTKDSNRAHQIGISKLDAGVSYDSHRFTNYDRGGFKWQKSPNGHELETGWYNLYIKIPNTTSGTDMVVITDDADLVLDDSVKFTDLAQYTDIVKPEFSGTLSTEYVDQTSVRVNLPDAIDDHLREIAYYINGEKKEFTAGTHTFSDLMPLSNVKIKAEAMDVLGNSVMAEDSVTLSKIEVADFAICDELGNKIDDISDLSSLSDVRATANVKSYTGEDVPVQIGIGIYDKNFERMIDFAWVDASAKTVADDIISYVLTLPQEVKDSPSDYAVRAFIWEKATGDGAVSSMPLSTEITLKEVE